MRLIQLLLFLLLPTWAWSQSLTATTITPLSATVSETSGLLSWNGRLITHNDSGDGPRLYEIDTLTGNVLRTVFVANASAQDWEAVCHDSLYLYIGDFGNNAGTRTNLRIFRVSWTSYLGNDTVQADTISFSYADQTDFSPATFQTNFDAEAFVALGDSLYIFTKNWGNFRSNVYPISKLPGTYSAPKRDSLVVGGLVTGATFDGLNNRIYLVGYTLSSQFIFEIQQPGTLPFSSNPTQLHNLQVPAATQTEAIAPLDATHCYVSAEASNNAAAHLYRVAHSTSTNIENPHFVHWEIHPQPGSLKLKVSGPEVEIWQLWSLQGQHLSTGSGNDIPCGSIAPGTYLLKIRPVGQKYFLTRPVLLR